MLQRSAEQGQGCGLCDFKTIQPVVNEQPEPSQVRPAPQPKPEKAQPQQAFTYRVHYSRLGDSRFYGHLELLQWVFRVLNRASLPVLFSAGFNPTPRVSFSQALPVGVESLAEFFDMDLARPLASMEDTVDQLNNQLPETMRVVAVTFAPRTVAMSSLTRYEISSRTWQQEALQERITSFLSQETFIIDRFRKNRHKDLDLRPLVARMELREGILYLELLNHQGQPGANPREILQKVLGCSEQEALLVRIMKTSVQEMVSPS